VKCLKELEKTKKYSNEYLNTDKRISIAVLG